MHVVNLVIGWAVDAALWPFRRLSPWAGMVAVSLLTAVLILGVFKLVSNQAAVRRAKDRIKAHLLETRLYKDSLRITLKAQAGILKANLSYMAANLKPLAVMIVPLVLILARLGLWYDRAPLRPGEQTLVKVGLVESADPLALDLRIEAPPSVEVTSPAVRIPDEREVVWRIRAREEGRGLIVVRTGGRSLEKSVTVGNGRLVPVSPVAQRGSIAKRVLYPGEPPLPEGTPVRAIEVLYPAAHLAAFGVGVHWLVAYLVLSVAFGFALKGVFKVEI